MPSMLTFAMQQVNCFMCVYWAQLHSLVLTNHRQAPLQFLSPDILLVSGDSAEYQLCQTFLILLNTITCRCSLLSIKAFNAVQFVGALELSKIHLYTVALLRQ